MNQLAVEVLFVLPASTGAVGQHGPNGLAGLDGLAGMAVLADEPGAAERSHTTAVHRVPGALPSPYAQESHRNAVNGGSSLRADRSRSASRRTHWPRGGRLRVIGTGDEHGYGGNLLGKIHAYAHRCQRLAERVDFDVIHAHDWMTFPAAQRLATASGRPRPMIAHVHATEFDRSGAQVNQRVYEIERAGMHAAEVVVAVSQRTAQCVIERYGVPAEKVRVVHNGIETNEADQREPMPRDDREGRGEKVVLFLGRLTMQKGPGFFIRAAARVLERMADVKFIVAGWGALAPRMIEEVAGRGLGQKILFTGFLRGADVDRAFREADVYVMPSVSEPFGLTALEAIRNGTPVIVSRTSGVAEVIDGGALTVDCWDVHRMAEQIVSLLDDGALAARVRDAGRAALRRLTWDEPARRCVALYDEVTRACAAAAG